MLLKVEENSQGELVLPYEKLSEGQNYWIADEFFYHKDALKLANRCFGLKKWKYGKPYTNELWPGARSANALRPKELLKVESFVKEVTGARKLYVANSEKVVVDTNTAILVGSEEGKARPHSDSRLLCKYAAVLYLNPKPDPAGGTSFYRQNLANGKLGGNTVPYPHVNLVDALKTNALPVDAWVEDEVIENRFNRLIVFKGNMVHSASKYFGKDKRDKRLAVTFFWLAD